MTSHAESPRRWRATVLPRVDVLETAAALVLIADVPGASEDSIDLTLIDDVLTLHAVPLVSAPPAEWGPTVAEAALPVYERTFRITADVERDSIHAALANGCLRVVLRKRRTAPTWAG